MTKTTGAGGLRNFLSSKAAFFLMAAFAVFFSQQAFAQAAGAAENVSLLHEAGQALKILFTWERMGFLSIGVILGLILGVIPGLGGLVGLSLLLPFTFDMDAYTALAMMMGLSAVTVTSDTIPAVMFGVPGTVGSAATILDGYPMARKGEAGRAYGAAFTASVIGGLWGALLLGVSIPILRPLILHIGSPELLSFCVFGLSLASVLSGGSLLKGLGGACIGLIIATAGDDPQTGTLRWTFDSLYLWDGLPVVPLALGLFAIPELADLAIQQKSINASGEDFERQDTRRGQLQGIKDCWDNWFLILRCATIGAGLGAVPGIGASVVDWIAYGHAARTEKDAALTFGKGDVRGVIASESSNNAKEGGALVPTIAFGVPGSASMALILGAFLIHGLVPGPDMITKKLDVTYTMVWSVAVANIMGAGVCFTFANQLAKLALLRVGILCPTVIAVVFVGAFQGSRQWGDIYALLGFGFLGFVMKRLRWPRPPLVLGFVLGGLVERYMFISVERYGAQWIYDITVFPVVVITFLLSIYGVASPAIRDYRERKKAGETRGASVFGFKRAGLDSDLAFTAVIFTLFSISLYISSGWEFGAKLVPQVVGYAAVLFLGLYAFSKLFYSKGKRQSHTKDDSGAVVTQDITETDVHFDIVVDFGDLSVETITRRAAYYFGWCLFFFGAAAVIGLLPSMFFFLVGYMRFWGKESWKMTLYIAVPLWAFCYFLFHKILIIPWPQTVVGDMFPVLRTMNDINLF
ncbi:MAG: tripartite tricarboxylate transporter permease [Proteobacteria bacterium]|nr:tripartite tricarboxylate transporter permease [Pseudomonadota bacterium]